MRKSRIYILDNPGIIRQWRGNPPFHGQHKAALLYPAGHPGRHNLFYPIPTFLQPYGAYRLYHSATLVFPGLFPVVTGLVLSDAKFGSPA